MTRQICVLVIYTVEPPILTSLKSLIIKLPLLSSSALAASNVPPTPDGTIFPTVLRIPFTTFSPSFFCRFSS